MCLVYLTNEINPNRSSHLLMTIIVIFSLTQRLVAVSYTHLDVYKRQVESPVTVVKVSALTGSSFSAKWERLEME